MDRSEDWRAFVQVATQRSFAKAAAQLGRSPQAITRAIAALEARLGTRLLNRTTRSVSLSHDGERYLDRAKNVIAELDALDAADTDPTPHGTVSVTAPVLFGQLHVAPVVTAYLARHERVTARLMLLDRVVSLAEEAVDLAVRIGELPDSTMLARRVGRVRTVLVASPAYLDEHGAPRTVDQLPKHACISFLGTSPALDRWTFDRRTVAITPRLAVNTGQAAIDAALAGLGIVRVLSYQVDRFVAAGRLRVLLESAEPPPVPVSVLSLPGMQSRIATAFGEELAAQLRKRLGAATTTS